MRSLEVRLGDFRVGTITNLDGDYNLFSFDGEYVENERRPILSQSFIGVSGNLIRRVPRTHRVAPPFFANVLPEEDSLLRRMIARQHGINRTRDFPFLRATGLDLPGAVTIRDPDERAEIVAEPEDAQTDAAPERVFRFSLAGVQLKFSASIVADRVSIPMTGVGGSWIVKLPTNAYARLPENEYAVMRLAASIGLDVPRMRLLDLAVVEGLPDDLPALRSDEPRVAYAIERFDRPGHGRRIHVEDFNQIASQPPADKYENKATHWIAEVLVTLCPEDVDEFVRRVVFGVCIGNNDMHLKNWSVVYTDGRNARLSPMYDYVCTRLYFPSGALALSVGGETSFDRIGRDALRKLAERGRISARRALAVADETVSALRERWPSFKQTIEDRELIAAIERGFGEVPLVNGR